MGLAASQARLLNLTARMHDIEYQAQNLEAQKLQMANESKMVYQQYEDALNKQKIEFKKIESDGSVKFEAANIEMLMKDGGYKVKIRNGNNWYEHRGAVLSGTPPTPTVTNDTADWSAVDGGTIPTDVLNELKALSLSSNELINSLVEAGYIIFVKEVEGEWMDFNVATDTNLQQVQDESGLKKAEAKYEADMRQINAKDKKFDTDLAALESERTAIKTEMETLKTVAKDNVDRTYKIF